MTTIIPCIERRSVRAFTLSEVMVASGLGVFVLAAILSSFLFIGRSGFGMQSYTRLESETRRGLEMFATDARMASDIHWNNSQSITLTLPTSTSATVLATYAYDSDATSPSNGCFYRLTGDASSTAPRQILVHAVAPDFAFQRYKLDATGAATTAANDLETKQVQLTLHARLAGVTVATAMNSAISARYILRNKRVSN